MGFGERGRWTRCLPTYSLATGRSPDTAVSRDQNALECDARMLDGALRTKQPNEQTAQHSPSTRTSLARSGSEAVAVKQ
jgi:hypothetical protein